MLTTIGVPKEMIPKICALKSGDSENQMQTFVNLVVFEDDVTDEQK